MKIKNCRIKNCNSLRLKYYGGFIIHISILNIIELSNERTWISNIRVILVEILTSIWFTLIDYHYLIAVLILKVTSR